jgi:hypothetical protein
MAALEVAASVGDVATIARLASELERLVAGGGAVVDLDTERHRRRQ